MTNIKIVVWDEESDQAVVYHDGEQVWTDRLSHIDQYLRFFMPTGEPVTIEVE